MLFHFKMPKKKNIILGLLLFGIILSFGQIAQAQNGNGNGDGNGGGGLGGFALAILNLPIKIGLAVAVMLLTFGIGMIQLLSAVLVYIAGIFLKWIILISVEGVEYTHGGVVDAGWAFCRDFANMFFIVILLVIAYATMLGKESYGMKKALMPLIIIALLINFSQTICGVIIDITNIFINFFISRGAADFVNVFIQRNVFFRDVLGLGGTSDFWSKLTELFGAEPFEFAMWSLAQVSKAFAGIIFNLLEFLVLIAYTVVFVMRIVVIWVLVILSPLAWICYVLPATRSFWDMWWKNFIQWAILGVIMLFFLYLAGFLLTHSEGVFLAGPGDMGAAPAATDPKVHEVAAAVGKGFKEVFAPIVSMIMLVLGLFLGFTAAGGAPGLATKITQAPVRWARGKAGEAAKVGGAAAGLKLMGRAGAETKIVGRGLKLLEKTPVVGKLMGGPGATRTKLETIGMTAVGKQLEPRHTEDLKEVAKLALGAKIKTPDDWAKLSKSMEILAKRGELRDFIDSLPDENKKRQALQVANQMGIDMSPLIKQVPELASAIGKDTAEVISKMTGGEYREYMKPDSIQYKDSQGTPVNFNATSATQLQVTLNSGTGKQAEAIAKMVNASISPALESLLKTKFRFAKVEAGELADAIESLPRAQQGQLKKDLREEVENHYLQNKPSGLTSSAEIKKFSKMLFEGLTNKNARV